MAIIRQGDLQINGVTRAYEGYVTIRKGGEMRTSNPQVNGQRVIVSSIENNFAEIKMTIRVTPENSQDFVDYFNNDDNNTITFRDESFVRCCLKELPEEEDTQTVEYVFEANPVV